MNKKIKTLKDKVAIVTGASRGLGAEIAQAFSREGAKVVGCSRTGDNETNKCDITNDDDVIEFFDEVILSQFENIDILVCNAGIYGPIGPVEDITSTAFLDTFKTNVMGTFNFCQEIIPIMKKQGHGKIIILSGGGATQPMPNFSAYAASKAAVVRFAETIAMELKDHNIQVNSVAPGMLKTDMVEKVIKAGSERVGEEFYEKNKNLTKEESDEKLKKAIELITYFASDESGKLTGKLIAAQWDPWETLKILNYNMDIINKSNLYTLRRIDE